MNLFTINMMSDALHKRTTVNVLCPQEAARGMELPTLTLLHGMTDDQSGWIRRTLAEEYAEEAGVCLAIPNADLSFYLNMAYGGAYLTFLAEELPCFLRNYFPVANGKRYNYVAGNSMGGYGAFLLAMRYPQQYRAAFSLSGPMKIAWIHRILADEKLARLYESGDDDGLRACVKRLKEQEQIPEKLVYSLLESGDLTRIFRGMFGEEGTVLDGSDVDLMELVRRRTFRENAVALYAYCGEQDYHYESNRLFAGMAASMGISYRLQTGVGSHDWKYWNRQLPQVFDIIAENRRQT